VEQQKQNAFTLGSNLIVAGESYEDLDELVARCILPMASLARDVLCFKYYKNIGSREAITTYLKREQERNSNKIHYVIEASLMGSGFVE
jgi:transcription elongation factor SPT6